MKENSERDLMIKRSLTNKGKKVRVNLPGNIWHNRIGTVTGFRGDFSFFENGKKITVPFVNFLDDGTKAIYPFRGDKLEEV